MSFYRDCRCIDKNQCAKIDAEFAEILQAEHERLTQNEKYRKNVLQNICKFRSIYINVLLVFVLIKLISHDICDPMCKWEMMFLCHTFGKNTVQWKAIKAILIGFSLTGINLFSGLFYSIFFIAFRFRKNCQKNF